MDKKEVEHYKNMAREELGLSEDHPIEPLTVNVMRSLETGKDFRTEIAESIVRDHPGLTVEEVLKQMESSGF